MMIYISLSTLLMLFCAAFLLISLAGVPGNWLMIGSAVLFDWLVIRDQEVFWLWTILGVIGLAVIGEVIELIAGAMGAKKFGGTKRASIGALIGGVAGAITGTMFLPLIGTIFGAVAGAFTLATVMELSGGRPKHEAVRAGQGAALGHAAGNLTKFAIGCVIWVVLLIAVIVQNAPQVPAVTG